MYYDCPLSKAKSILYHLGFGNSNKVLDILEQVKIIHLDLVVLTDKSRNGIKVLLRVTSNSVSNIFPNNSDQFVEKSLANLSAMRSIASYIGSKSLPLSAVWDTKPFEKLLN